MTLLFRYGFNCPNCQINSSEKKDSKVLNTRLSRMSHARCKTGASRAHRVQSDAPGHVLKERRCPAAELHVKEALS